MRKLLIRTGLLAAIASALAAAPAGAAVPVGQVATTPTGNCDPGADHVQVSVAPGTASYVMPASGTLTNWSMRASAALGQRYQMKVYRPLGGLTFQVVGHSSTTLITAGALNVFPVSVPVKAGDVLGLNTVGPGTPACEQAGATGDTAAFRAGSLADGGSGLFAPLGGPPKRLNIAATLEPTNTFLLGAITANKKKGNATLAVTLPNPGQLTVAGDGIVVPAPIAAVAGDVQVLIQAQGKTQRKLAKKGKATVSLTLTYTPTGGTATTQTATVGLKKNKKKKKKK